MSRHTDKLISRDSHRFTVELIMDCYGIVYAKKLYICIEKNFYIADQRKVKWCNVLPFEAKRRLQENYVVMPY